MPYLPVASRRAVLAAAGVDPRNLRVLVLEQLGEGDDLQAREGAAGFLLRPDADGGSVAFHRAGRGLSGEKHADGRASQRQTNENFAVLISPFVVKALVDMIPVRR